MLTWSDPTACEIRSAISRTTRKNNKGGNANLLVQVLLSAAAMTLHARWFDPSRECLTKACVAIKAANLRFIPVTGRPPVLTEDVRERVVVLSQVI